MDEFDREKSGENPLHFNPVVPDNGYRWWYVDGVSDDGKQGIVIIAFIGSVFSPYYYRARQAAPARALEFCAINVGLYDPRHRRWCMTERNSSAVDLSETRFSVGASSLEWQGNSLVVQIDERSSPFLRKVRGTVRLTPSAHCDDVFVPDSGGRHRWHPIAPMSRIEVDLSSPSIRWAGSGYFDTNYGSVPLETDFRNWNWSRSVDRDACHINYCLEQRDGTLRSTAVRIDKAGNTSNQELPGEIELRKGLWQVRRTARSDKQPVTLRDLEDTPFYTRSLLRYDDCEAVHEYLDLDRFQSGWVRFLLPFRMPRKA